MTLDDRVRSALHSRSGAPLRLGYAAATGAQLRFAEAWDSFRHPSQTLDERADVAADVTMAMKTFLRPKVARRCVRTARRVFDGRVVIADDSHSPISEPDDRCDVLALPFNSGVPVGRNAALDQVQTEYTLITDDDIVFTKLTHVHRALNYLRDNPEVDIVGFVRVELPRRYYFDHPQSSLSPRAETPLRGWGEVIGGLPVRYKIEQIYLARTESLHKIRWDESLRMVDHGDFFNRASGTLVTVLDHGIVTYHARTPFDATYTAYRDDVAADLEKIRERWS
ncbi:glycosyltransferase [Ornithinimicrobium sp. Y1847]|uniref:glycosyltransferase n=1 Tax=Ornithinimicrobium sp. Y1847 TaxID=3405419 RepID=UPI003B682064